MSSYVPHDDLIEFLTELAATTDMSAAAVNTAIEAYPDRRDEILRFAIDWQSNEFALDDEKFAPLPAVDFSSYQRGAIIDPFEGKSPVELKSTAAFCGIPLSLLSKLESRAIKAETIPLLLVRLLASSLGTDVASLLGFFSLRPTLAAGVQYRADSPPEARAQVSFAEAIRTTTMGDDQRRRWLDLSE